MNYNANEDIRHRPDVIRLKRRFGIMYGMTAGLAFATASWGIDGYLISQAFGFYPWVKFIIGAVICMAAGALAGWLVARSEKAIVGLPVYLLLGFLFSWLIMAIPFQIFPKIVAMLDPEAGNLLNYTLYEGFQSRFWVAFTWISVFAGLVGLLQIPLAEPAAFATSNFGRLAPLLLCAVLMFINGIIVDRLNNEAMRLALIYMNNTIQYTVDNQGKDVDYTEARKMHIYSLRSVADVVTQPRQMIVGSYDQYLDQIHVLVRFGTTWTDCNVVYNQPSFCKYIEGKP